MRVGRHFITPVTSHDILSYAPVKMNIFPIGSSSLKYLLAMRSVITTCPGMERQVFLSPFKSSKSKRRKKLGSAYAI